MTSPENDFTDLVQETRASAGPLFVSATGGGRKRGAGVVEQTRRQDDARSGVSAGQGSQSALLGNGYQTQSFLAWSR